ncbi:hypothetical protein ACH5RR_013686 [Cinchona calisaya]|uniref:Uncharacterized protein n=1 Tax=Cinchona calisaya TaxID=153742 RepID=A0ABD3A0Q1_9GENT
MMALSGVTGCPIRYKFQIPAYQQASLSSHTVKSVNFFYKQITGSDWAASSQRSVLRITPLVRCAMDASYGDSANASSATFPGINVRDPYKVLRISREASADEIQSARILLLQRYASHKPSVDAIESAHN